jgi:hypothetical protein
VKTNLTFQYFLLFFTILLVGFVVTNFAVVITNLSTIILEDKFADSGYIPKVVAP